MIKRLNKLSLCAAAIGALGIVFAVVNRFVQDDAYISFRYARNLADGLGLVWNAGERVEGYTNFLWTLMLAPAAWPSRRAAELVASGGSGTCQRSGYSHAHG